MTVHTTYFAALDYDKAEPAEDDAVVSVVRRPAGWTEDLVERNLEALAPPEQLLDAYKRVEEAAEADDDCENPQETAWESVNFTDRYREHLLANSLSSVLGSLREREHAGDIWLVCYEKDPQHCHRRLLADELTRGRKDDPVHHPEPGVDAEPSGIPDASLDAFRGGAQS